MKAVKSIFIIVCIVISMLVSSCGNDETKQVTIYFDSISQLNPNEIDCSQYAKENGFISAEKYGNEYMIVTMSKSRYEEYEDEIWNIAMDSINECLCSYVKKIECNSDFTENIIYVESEEYKTAFDLTEYSVAMNSYYYQSIFGISPSCKITIIDFETGETISSYTENNQ